MRYMPKNAHWLAGLLVLVAGSLHETPAAGTIYQHPALDFVKFEAENFDTNGGTRNVVVDTTPTLVTDYGSPVLPIDTNASRGAAVLVHPKTGSVGPITYNLIFQTPGTYYLYKRFSVFESTNGLTNYGNEDSIFVALDFNSPVVAADAYVDDFNTMGHVPGDGFFEGVNYVWEQVTLDRESGRPALTFEVTTADLGQPLAFSWRAREYGASLDAFVFSTQSGLAGTELDRLVIPEPSSLLIFLTLTGMISLIPLRRRRRR